MAITLPVDLARVPEGYQRTPDRPSGIAWTEIRVAGVDAAGRSVVRRDESHGGISRPALVAQDSSLLLRLGDRPCGAEIIDLGQILPPSSF